MKPLLFISGFIMILYSSKAQDTAIYPRRLTPELGDIWKEFTLLDKDTGSKFILDSLRISIRAVDKSGNVLWITDPYKDSNLWKINSMEQRPLITRFHFRKDKGVNDLPEIFIEYTTRVYGCINLRTGEFTFLGAD
jgi:hypothetical protein